ncbi:MAG: hypothetical protein ACYS7Y_35555 [Planctomycetota bacterium]|jgi:hypothetical protein
MNKTKDNPLVLLGVLTSLMLMAGFALANGGPFVLKYPNGDPAAKGILARLDPDLKPARETRLRVIKEDLKVTFGKDGRRNQHSHPLAHVIAEYTVENPTADQIEIDFGFPILRGVFINPRSMRPSPAVDVTIGEEHIRATIISNSAIYGIIRKLSPKTKPWPALLPPSAAQPAMLTTMRDRPSRHIWPIPSSGPSEMQRSWSNT